MYKYRDWKSSISLCFYQTTIITFLQTKTNQKI